VGSSKKLKSKGETTCGRWERASLEDRLEGGRGRDEGGHPLMGERTGRELGGRTPGVRW
jgi:hypothetical protein